MKTWFLSALLFATAPPLVAQLPAKLVPAQSEIAFVSKQLGVPVEGKFSKFDAQVVFDPRKPETGKVALAIEIASAALGVPEVDVELPKPIWFSSAKFPQATFQSTAINGLGSGRFEVAGKLTIKGNTRDVVVPIALTQSGTVTTASGTFAIKRLEFKIGEGEWADTSMVANDVQVKFKLALTGVEPL